MNILEAINFGKEYLKNSETSTLDTKIILANILNINKNELILYKNKVLTVQQENDFKSFLSRRLIGEPVSKIFHKKAFWKYNFFTNENVLDPRNDSEILIETVLNECKNSINEKINILDLGTGSGCLIITLLKEFKNANGLAVDINEKSLEVAKKNAVDLQVDSRLQFIKNNWNDNIDKQFDIIVSNPPYIKSDDITALSNDVKNFDPLLALDGGDNGLECYKYLAEHLMKNCKESTKIFLEIGYEQANDVRQLFEHNNFKYIKLVQDLQGLDRVLVFII